MRPISSLPPTPRQALGLAAVAAIVLVSVGAPAATAKPLRAEQQDAASAAGSCPAGNLCVWDQPGFGGSRCMWSDADNDWQAGSIHCSWSASRPVQSMKNMG